MLRELRIQNFAIIDELHIDFRPGLNVITGETGSGKSIIMGALGLLSGGRAGTEVVRTDADAASIEALFDHPAPGTSLEAIGLGPDDDLMVRRIIPHAGKGRVYLNGSPTTVAQLAELGGQLIHLYGQHDQALLLNAGSHLDFLDAFGDLGELRGQMAAAFAALNTARTDLLERARRRDAQQERRDLLEFQLQELRGAAVEPDEEERLRREREVLRHTERLQQVSHEAEAALYSSDASTNAGLARVASQLRELVSVDPSLQEPTELIESARIQLEDAALQLRRYAHRLHFDPDRLAAIDDRLALLGRLARKYKVTSAELPATLAALEDDVRGVESVTADCASLQQRVEELTAAALGVAHDLSRARKKEATRLEREMGQELGTLGLSGARFAVVAHTPDGDAAGQVNATGYDTVEFFLSANLGEAPKPLARVASGGELSRILLALKALTAAAAETPILIFDEVDAGIGGQIADAVARRLATLARNRQLLCITHLPQIAAYADHHCAVEKRVTRGRTVTHARVLDPSERVHEIVRMLGGAIAPAEAERYAQRLLTQARSGR